MSDDEPKIKSYLPLDEDSGELEEEEVTGEPTAEKEELPEVEGKQVEPEADLKKREDEQVKYSLEEERAFAVGLTTIIVVLSLAAFIVVWQMVATRQHKTEGEVKPAKVESQPENPFSETQSPPSESASQSQSGTSAEGKTYTVETGDTLYSLGTKLKVDWKKIAEINNIEEPYTLRTGQKLIIPAQ